MKNFLLSLFTMPGLIILIYLIGLFTIKVKKRIKLYSIGLLITFVISCPIFSKLISYPLISLPKHLSSEKIDNAEAVVILTGGIYKNILGKWQPSNSTQNRVYSAMLILSKYNIPLVISGGSTKPNSPSEAVLTKNYYNLSASLIDSNSLNTYQSAVNLKKYCSTLNGPLLLNGITLPQN